MPRHTPVTAHRDPKRTIRARARASRYAARARAAAEPAEAHAVARRYLMSAVKNADAPARQAQRLSETYAPVVDDLIEVTAMPAKRAAHYRAQLAEPGRGPVAQLAQTLRLLHAAAGDHPDTDAVHTYYTHELTDAARQLDAAHMRRRTTNTNKDTKNDTRKGRNTRGSA